MRGDRPDVNAVLTDEDEDGQEDRLERHNHGEKLAGTGRTSAGRHRLQARENPKGEPYDVEDEEDATAKKASDGVAEALGGRSAGQRGVFEIDYGADVVIARGPVRLVNGQT